MLIREKKEKGQTLIETVLLVKIIALLTTLVLYYLYFIYSNQIVDFFSQRSLLCLETVQKTKKQCANDLEMNLNRLLFFHKPVKILMYRKKRLNKVVVKAEILKKTRHWKNKLKKEL